jgi:hypothetical protein
VKRAPRARLQSLVEGIDRQGTGGARSVANAFPVAAYTFAIGEAQAGATLGGAGEAAKWYDEDFTLASDGAQDVTLTFLPIEYSEDIKLNGVGAERTTEWTRSGQVVSLDAALDARTGDELTVHYQYLLGSPVEPVVGLGDYPTAVMTDGPIAYWRLDEASGTSVADSTGHGHTGTTNAGSGTVTRATSTLLTAANGGVRSTKFEGYGARVDVPTSSAFDTAAFTIEFFTSKGGSTLNPIWHHPGRLRILQSGTATDVYFWAAGAWVHKHRFAGLSGSDDGSNHHVAITYDGSTMLRYIEGGVENGTVMAAGTLTAATAGPQFGDGADLTNDGSAFRVQEFAVYGTALSAARIAAHVAVR